MQVLSSSLDGRIRTNGLKLNMNRIEVKDTYKIFGHKPLKQAYPLIEKGESKSEIFRKTGCTVAVNNASFEVGQNEIFVVMGLSGSGKSTLLRLINRLIDPTSGEILIDGEDVCRFSKERLRDLRRGKMSMVFQHFGLLPHRTVLENVGFGMEIQKTPEEERIRKSKEAIELVGLEQNMDSMIAELSGGMQQRVGLARGLATDPEIMLMDEAFSALDPLIRTQMQDELLQIQAKMHKSILFITHDLDEALKLGDRVAIMKDGFIDQIGTPEQILTNPATEYVQAFVENVDRSKVITAGTAMHKTSALVEHTVGPHLCARRMHQLDWSVLLVVDDDRNFLGYVTIDDVLALAERTPEEEDQQITRNIESVIRKDMPTTGEETPVIDLLSESAEKDLPIAVLEEDGIFKGVITRPALLAAISGD